MRVAHKIVGAKPLKKRGAKARVRLAGRKLNKTKALLGAKHLVEKYVRIAKVRADDVSWRPSLPRNRVIVLYKDDTALVTTSTEELLKNSSKVLAHLTALLRASDPNCD